MSGTYNVLCAILKELQAIHNILEPSKRNVFLKLILMGKAFQNVFLMELLAVQKSIRDTDVED